MCYYHFHRLLVLLKRLGKMGLHHHLRHHQILMWVFHLYLLLFLHHQLQHHSGLPQFLKRLHHHRHHQQVYYQLHHFLQNYLEGD
jgi:hypothetical protein